MHPNLCLTPREKKRASPVGAPGGPPEERGVSGGLPLRKRVKCIWEYIRSVIGSGFGSGFRSTFWSAIRSVFRSTLSSNSPPGIPKLFTTGKSHAPAHSTLGMTTGDVISQ